MTVVIICRYWVLGLDSSLRRAVNRTLGCSDWMLPNHTEHTLRVVNTRVAGMATFFVVPLRLKAIARFGCGYCSERLTASVCTTSPITREVEMLINNCPTLRFVRGAKGRPGTKILARAARNVIGRICFGRCCELR